MATDYHASRMIQSAEMLTLDDLVIQVAAIFRSGLDLTDIDRDSWAATFILSASDDVPIVGGMRSTGLLAAGSARLIGTMTADEIAADEISMDGGLRGMAVAGAMTAAEISASTIIAESIAASSVTAGSAIFAGKAVAAHEFSVAGMACEQMSSQSMEAASVSCGGACTVAAAVSSPLMTGDAVASAPLSSASLSVSLEASANTGSFGGLVVAAPFGVAAGGASVVGIASVTGSLALLGSGGFSLSGSGNMVTASSGSVLVTGGGDVSVAAPGKMHGNASYAEYADVAGAITGASVLSIIALTSVSVSGPVTAEYYVQIGSDPLGGPIYRIESESIYLVSDAQTSRLIVYGWKN